MPKATFTAIEHLVAEQEQDADVLRVIFRCPETGREVDADALLEKTESAGVGTVARDAAKREASWGVFRWVSNAISSLMGGGIAGDIVGRVGGEVASDQVRNAGDYVYTTEQKQAAVLEAFGNVEDEFAFDDDTQQWKMRAN